MKSKIPREHPVAWASPLWPHLALIQDMRQRRKPWKFIIATLEKQHGVKTTRVSLFRFFKRATDPNRKRPLGFPPVPKVPPEATPLTSTPDLKERYLRNREEAKAPAIKPLPTIDPDDD